MEVSTEMAWSTEDPLGSQQSWKFNPEYLNILAGSIGTLGNGFAVMVLMRYKKMRNRVWSILLINQCILDLLGSLITVVYHLRGLIVGGGFQSPYQGQAGDWFCKLWVSAIWHWSLMGASSYNLLAISVERYLMVVHPIYHKNHVSRRRTTITAAVPWSIGAAFQMSYGIPTSELRGDTCATYAVWPDVLTAHAAGVLSTIVPFFLPAAVMTFLYARIVMVMRSKQQFGQQTSNLSSAQKNLTKTCVVIVLAFVGCWSWSQFFWLLYNLGADIQMGEDLHFVVLLMVYLNCSVNPFIYTFTYGEFRDAVRSTFGCTKLANAHVAPAAIAGSSTGGQNASTRVTHA